MYLTAPGGWHTIWLTRIVQQCGYTQELCNPNLFLTLQPMEGRTMRSFGLKTGSILRQPIWLSLGFLLWSSATASAQTANWPQWGGPQRNFMVDAKGLAETWPAGGPKRLWSRALGEGHSSVVVDADRLYTMYSRGEQEFVVALDAATGKTVWEKSYAAPTRGLELEFGKGPHSTPLIAGNLLITVGVIGKLQAFEKQTGNPVWSNDLWQEYGGKRMGRGYSCSPLAYKNTVILTVGGAGQSLMAFDMKTGAVVWKKQDFDLSPSTPTIIKVDGQDQ